MAIGCEDLVDAQDQRLRETELAHAIGVPHVTEMIVGQSGRQIENRQGRLIFVRTTAQQSLIRLGGVCLAGAAVNWASHGVDVDTRFAKPAD